MRDLYIYINFYILGIIGLILILCDSFRFISTSQFEPANHDVVGKTTLTKGGKPCGKPYSQLAVLGFRESSDGSIRKKNAMSWESI